MSRNISWNICRGIATSAIWKATWRPWLTTFAPILIGISFRLVSDQSLIGWACQHAQEISEVTGERMKLEAHGVGRERSRTDGRVHLIAPLPSLIHCSHVPRLL